MVYEGLSWEKCSLKIGQRLSGIGWMSRLDLDGFEKSDKIFAMVPYHILPPSGDTPNSAHIYGLH